MRCRLALRTLTLSLLLPACMTWRPTTEATLRERPDAVRLVTVDGREVLVRRPLVVRDSVVGWSLDGDVRLAVALADIERTDVRDLSEGRTAALGAGVGAVAGVALAGAAALVAMTFVMKVLLGE